MHLYTTLWNINEKCEYITIITNKHFGKIEKKTLQTNIAMNDQYDTRLCGFNMV